MKTTILLIRHGETDWNLDGRWQGHADIPLNETGAVQAKALAARLASWPIKAIYCSDLQRARQTAEILGRVLGLRPCYDRAWRERNGGEFEGLTFHQLRREHWQAWQALRRAEAAPPGGESRLSVAQRAASAFESIAERHQGEMTAVVTHGGVLVTLISYLLGLPLGARAQISVSGNSGLNIVEIGDQGPYVTLLNDVSHLS